MILAALDTGSARCGLVIAAHAPPAALVLLHHQLFPVGHLEELAAPITTTSKAGKTWTRTHRRVLSPDEEGALVTAIVEQLLAHGVRRLLLEASAPYLPDGAPIAALRAQVREVAVSAGIAKRVQDRCGLLGIAVELAPRVTWLAALRRHAAAGLTLGVGAIDKALGKRGAALDPLLRAHLPQLFAGRLPEAGGDAQAESDEGEGESEGGEERPAREVAPGPDLRDAAGLLLSAVLEIPASAARAPRAPRVASAGGEAPARGPREPRAERSPRRGARLAGEAWRVAEKAERAAKRALLGCTCRPGPGRPSRECPAYPAHVAASTSRGPMVAVLSVRAHETRAGVIVEWLACGHEVERPASIPAAASRHCYVPGCASKARG